jgi:nitrile hydratase accessory protein
VSVLPDLPPAAAPPRSNGEPVFDAPWQSRAFGMVVSLHERGAFDWGAFRDRLADELRRSGSDGATAYYESWVRAFHRLVVDGELLPAGDIDARRAEFATGARREVF